MGGLFPQGPAKPTLPRMAQGRDSTSALMAGLNRPKLSSVIGTSAQGLAKKAETAKRSLIGGA